MSSHTVREAQPDAGDEYLREYIEGSGGRNNALPVELVVRVFAMLPMRALIRATSICVNWREIAIGTPGLWQHFSIQLRSPSSYRDDISAIAQPASQSEVHDMQDSISDPASLSLLQLYIERSRDMPMTVRCLHDQNYAHRHMCVAFLNFLLPQWHRIRALHVPAERLEHKAFRLAAPLLEELVLGTPCLDSDRAIPEVFLAGVQNRLHRLVLVGNVHLPTNCPTLGSLTTLHAELLTEDTLASVFALCPQLQDVSARWLAPTPGSTWRIVPPATLRSLKIFARQHSNILTILPRPIPDSLKHLWIGSVLPDQLGDCRSVFDALGKIVDARMSVSDSVMIQLSLEDARGAQFTVRFGPHFGSAVHETGVLHQLSTLLESCDLANLHTLTISASLGGALNLFALRHAPIRHLVLQSFGQFNLSPRSAQLNAKQPITFPDLQDVTFVVDRTTSSVREVQVMAFFLSLVIPGTTKLQRIVIRASGRDDDDPSLFNLPSTVWSSWSESIFPPPEHNELEHGSNTPSPCTFFPNQGQLLKQLADAVQVLLPAE